MTPAYGPDVEIIDVIEKLENAEDADIVLAQFSEYVGKFGFDSVALAHLVNPALLNSFENEWFNHSTWPGEWYDSWLDQRWILHDPIARFALKTTQPFTWKQAYDYGSKFGRAILDRSREFGFEEGFAIPVRSIDSPPGCVSLGGKNVDLSSRSQACIELAARHCFSKLEQLHAPLPLGRPVNLSKRETETLHYAAAGKTDWEISVILSIGEETVRQYMRSIRKKLCTSNRAHAVSVAIQQNLILP